MKKQDVVEAILKGRPSSPGEAGRGTAPANIALGKYWGKRNEELNLPVTSSLSISLGELGADTEIVPAETDSFYLNGDPVPADDPFARRAAAFLDLFRPDPSTGFRFSTVSRIPVAAGLASSASGFASTVLALNDLFGWGLEPRACSILARLGSGSASRSVYHGFAQWHAGGAEDGMDSFAEPLNRDWPDFRIGILELSDKPKPIGSRPAMQRTVETAELYAAWPAQANADLETLRAAIETRDFPRLGETAEGNAMAMHATMIATRPAILYWQPESVAAMQEVWAAREDGLPLYFTMDAGPNLKLLFLQPDRSAVRDIFPEIKIINPFDQS
ncbi:MAG: diphosphomevalonate decarboxylase [Verrucomicrobiota bacterium]